MKPHLQHRPFRVAVAAAVCAIAGGCATMYEVKVDAISKPATKGVTSYKITTKHPSLEGESLRAQEAEVFVKTALSSKGLYEAPNPEAADMVVVIDFGIEPPRVRMEATSVPVYARTGGGIRYEEVSITDPSGSARARTVAVYEPPRIEMVGYEEVVMPVQVYEKYLRISAHENKPAAEGKAPAELWSVNVSSEDQSKDLRKYLPLLASASADYIGKDTSSEKIIKLKENDPGAVFVKKGM